MVGDFLCNVPEHKWGREDGLMRARGPNKNRFG